MGKEHGRRWSKIWEEGFEEASKCPQPKEPKKIPTQTRKVIYLYILLVLLRCNFGGVILWVVIVVEGKCVLFVVL